MSPNNQPQPDTDQILHYLTSAARSIVKDIDNGYSPEGKRTITHIYNWLRGDLMAGNLAEYEKSYDDALRKYPDEASELYDVMYEHAGLGMEGTYEEFMAKCSERQVNEFGRPGLEQTSSREPQVGETCLVRGFKGKAKLVKFNYDKAYVQFESGRKEIVDRRALMPKKIQPDVVKEDASCGATSVGAFATGAVGAAKPKKIIKRKSAVGEGIDQVDEGYWDEAMKKFEKEQARRKATPNEKFEKNPASHDKDGIYKGDKDLDGKPVRKTNTGK